MVTSDGPAGHLRPGGPANRLNVRPGNGKPIDDGLANLNQGEHARMERYLRQRLKGKSVDIEITPVYPTGGGTRPDLILVNTTVNGRPRSYEFVNNEDP